MSGTSVLLACAALLVPASRGSAASWSQGMSSHASVRWKRAWVPEGTTTRLDILEILDGTGPAKNRPVRVDPLPGSTSRYSRGGTKTVGQLAIEDVTNLGFTEAARRYLFEPPGMFRSTYEDPLPPSHGNIARAHGPDGTGPPWLCREAAEACPRRPRPACGRPPTDYARLIIALVESYHGGADTFLSQRTAREMMTPVPPGIFGLGPEIDGEDPTRNFVHGGANDSYRAFMAGCLAEGDGKER